MGLGVFVARFEIVADVLVHLRFVCGPVPAPVFRQPQVAGGIEVELDEIALAASKGDEAAVAAWLDGGGHVDAL